MKKKIILFFSLLLNWRCRFEKQARLKQYEDANETDDENKKPITISIPVSDEPKTKQTPVKISVRHTSDSSRIFLEKRNLNYLFYLDEKYSDDFDGSDHEEKQKTKTLQVKFN